MPWLNCDKCSASHWVQSVNTAPVNPLWPHVGGTCTICHQGQYKAAAPNKSRFLVCSGCYRQFSTDMGWQINDKCLQCGRGWLQAQSSYFKKNKQGKKRRSMSHGHIKYAQEYIRGMNKCPFCKSSYITTLIDDGKIKDCLADDAHYASRPMCCMSCSAKWFDVYKLFDVDVISYPTED